MFTFFRAIIYAILFISLVLIYIPSRFLLWIGFEQPESMGIQQLAGIIISLAGIALALWCVFAFASLGKGTPAPFDPPKRLVVRGPYRFSRNPMYIGAGIALIGAAMYYNSWVLIIYTIVLFFIVSGFIRWYEEPVLRRTFREEYDAYCRRVGRWLPRKSTTNIDN